MEKHPETGGMVVANHLTYAIVIESGDENYSAYVPDVPGCVATGVTVDETIATMREALRLHLALSREYGEEIPLPRTQVATVEVDSAA